MAKYMSAEGLAKLAKLGYTEQDLRDWQEAVGAKPDGDPGPLTFAATIAALRLRGMMPSTHPPAPVSGGRARVVEIALSQLGPGRSPAHHDPQEYIRTAAPIYIGQPPNAKAWCGIFALWCLREAGLTTKVWKDGVGFALGYLPIVQLPEPGDVMYFGGRLSHYAIVERCSDGHVWTIEGNTLAAPAEGVTAKVHPITSETFRRDGGCYFSIRELVA
jgi:hypothetical protein